MHSQSRQYEQYQLPQDYAVIPLSSHESENIVGIGILAKIKTADDSGRLITLRDALYAKVYLGCLFDTQKNILKWLEIWVQHIRENISAPIATHTLMTNAYLDDQWQRLVRAFEHLPNNQLIKTGWETVSPHPALIDMKRLCCITPVHESSGQKWRLCTDEGLLQSRGLASYQASLNRYLYIPSLGPDSPFLPINEESAPEQTADSAGTLFDQNPDWIPFNIAAGRILIRSFDPMNLEDFFEFLSLGSPGFSGTQQVVKDLIEPTGILYKQAPETADTAGLFQEKESVYAKLSEVFYLKIRLLLEMIQSIKQIVKTCQRPMFTLNPQSWQIRLIDPAAGLPTLWSARSICVDAGNSYAVSLGHTEKKVYVSETITHASIYRPSQMSLPVKGTASVRIRQILPEDQGTLVLEGTFTSKERLSIAPEDYAGMRFQLAHTTVDVYALLETDSALAQGEWRFRTIRQHFDPAQMSDLKAIEGVPLQAVPFETIPLISSPVDIYSLAVLAVQLFFVDAANTLPVALDEILSLARQVAQAYRFEDSLPARIADLFNQDPRWIDSLGPQHLIRDDISSQEAFNCIPAACWFEMLGILVQMLPGAGPDSTCKGFGDALQGGLDLIFQPSIDGLYKLLIKVRCLVISDWKTNRQIWNVVSKYIEPKT